jgi:hypothetical protein
LYTNDLNPYAGGVFYHVRVLLCIFGGHVAVVYCMLMYPLQSPVYLFLFTYLVPITSSALTALLWTAADLIAALLLVKIWQSRSVSRQARFVGRDFIVALL